MATSLTGYRRVNDVPGSRLLTYSIRLVYLPLQKIITIHDGDPQYQFFASLPRLHEDHLALRPGEPWVICETVGKGRTSVIQSYVFEATKELS